MSISPKWRQKHHQDEGTQWRSKTVNRQQFKQLLAPTQQFEKHEIAVKYPGEALLARDRDTVSKSMTDEEHQHPRPRTSGEQKDETTVHDVDHDNAVEAKISVDEATKNAVPQSNDSVEFTSSPSSSDMETPPSTKHKQHLHHQHTVEPTCRASRQAELDELRSKHLAKSIRSEFAFVDGTVPSGTSDLTSFVLQQKEQEQELRRKKQDSAEYLHRYQNSNVPIGRKRSPRGVVPPTPPANATSSEMDLFYQQQRQLGQEWRQHQKDSLDYLHSYRGTDVGPSRSLDAEGHIDTERDLDTSSEARESIIVEDKTDHRHYNFEEMQRSLEDRLARAAQCPLPDSFDSIEDKGNLPEKQIVGPETETANCKTEIGGSREQDDNAMASTNERSDADEASCPSDIKSPAGSEGVVEKEEEMIHKHTDIEESKGVQDIASVTQEPSAVTNQEKILSTSMDQMMTPEGTSSTSQGLEESKIVHPRARTPSSLANKKLVATLSPARTPVLSPSAIRLKKAIEEVSRPWRNKPSKPLNLYESKHKGQKCERKWRPSIHSEKGGCELCLALATKEERQKFEKDGHHYRVNIVKGGCERTCRQFRRSEDKPAVRLCRRCFHITHKHGE